MSKRKLFWLGASLVVVLLVSVYAISRTQATLDEVPLNADGNRILYLVSSSNPSSEIASRVQQELNTSAQENPSFLQSLETPRSIDALVIDGSVSSKELDPTWLESAYDSGVIIVMLDKYAPEVAELVGDPSVMADNFASESYPDHFYVSVYRVTRGLPEDVARIIENKESGSKQPVPNIGGTASVGGGRATESLESDYGYDTLKHIVTSSIQAVREYPTTK